MGRKEEKAMTRTSHHGTDRKTVPGGSGGGFVLLDALLCLFVTGLLLLFVQTGVRAFQKTAAERSAAGIQLIEERNALFKRGGGDD
jgi:hypothetical protein